MTQTLKITMNQKLVLNGLITDTRKGDQTENIRSYFQNLLGDKMVGVSRSWNKKSLYTLQVKPGVRNYKKLISNPVFLTNQ